MLTAVFTFRCDKCGAQATRKTGMTGLAATAAPHFPSGWFAVPAPEAPGGAHHYCPIHRALFGHLEAPGESEPQEEIFGDLRRQTAPRA